MDDIPPRSYGEVIETTLRIVTWNVWGRYGPWLERERAIVATLRDARPDVVVLTESWSRGGDSQCGRLAGPRGPVHVYGLVLDAWWFDESQARQDAVRACWPRSARLRTSGPRLSSVGIPWATQLLWPSRRIDYIFSATPRPGGAGHPTAATLLGTSPIDGVYPSDYYALQSSLRY